MALELDQQAKDGSFCYNIG